MGFTKAWQHVMGKRQRIHETRDPTLGEAKTAPKKMLGDTPHQHAPLWQLSYC